MLSPRGDGMAFVPFIGGLRQRESKAKRKEEENCHCPVSVPHHVIFFDYRIRHPATPFTSPCLQPSQPTPAVDASTDLSVAAENRRQAASLPPPFPRTLPILHVHTWLCTVPVSISLGSLFN
ncbi:unnamed protein product [Periconia digitata]|uniref:Uncharacterized protein n=1 Tax=Periconia digitata TaxID=1303443 RepID=A0A9W4XL45_9PLEO|nr:unnamed protein product [Periconia digitata]